MKGHKQDRDIYDRDVNPGASFKAPVKYSVKDGTVKVDVKVENHHLRLKIIIYDRDVNPGAPVKATVKYPVKDGTVKKP